MYIYKLKHDCLALFAWTSSIYILKFIQQPNTKKKPNILRWLKA
jgi:hypothetical protein